MSIDYNSKNKNVGAKKGKSGSFPVTTKYPKDSKNNNKFTGFTVKSGGSHASAGTDGLHTTKVSRPVDTAYNKDKVEWKGGGVPSDAVVKQQTPTVKVKPC